MIALDEYSIKIPILQFMKPFIKL